MYNRMMDLLIENIKKIISQGARSLLLFDYDGTLTPIVHEPSAALLDKDVRNMLQQLTTRELVDVGVVTGRSLKDIKEFIDLPGISYITNHGHLMELDGEVKSFGADYFNKEKHFGVKYEKLLKQLKAFPELTVETKEFSTSFHYRNVKESDQEKCRKTILHLLQLFFGAKEILIKEGKKVIDILPPEPMDKGIAIKYLLETFRKNYPGADFLVIFIGDDLTDEDGFRYLNEIKQISVKVGEGETVARYRLSDVYQVHALISSILEMTGSPLQPKLFNN